MGRTYKKVNGFRRNSFASSKSPYTSIRTGEMYDAWEEEKKAQVDKERRQRREMKREGLS